ncbi:MAG TPA: hypothetical protein ENI95_03300 [Chloroflexi bacterium]|nr:hypothetical protein [Chloroflexota bacterium]
MRRYLPALLWLSAMYTLTALTADLNPSPEGGIELVLYEGRQVTLHLAAYAIQAGLLAFALNGRLSLTSGVKLMGLILLIGLGQETIQALLRGRVLAGASAFDLGVDMAGAAVGLWLAGRILPEGGGRG